jgi:methylated-DNA-[protein]-cysteine S-methyltransferase
MDTTTELGPAHHTTIPSPLGEYFSGRRRVFDVALIAEGNEFEQNLWDPVRLVPYGETSTYGALARLLDDGTRAREVGGAVGRNPLSILVPCHRIVGLEKHAVGRSGRLF